jgi:hypothetical protein
VGRAGSGEEGDCEECEKVHCVVGSYFLLTISKILDWQN